MKNHLLLFLLALCLVPSRLVFAADSDNTDINKPLYTVGSKDEKGCYTSGMIINYDETSGKADRFILSGSHLYCVASENSIALYGDNGSSITYEWLNTSSNIWNVASKNVPLSNDNPFMCSPRYNVYGSIPVFDSSKSDFEESVKNYLENGDSSGATNAKELNEKYTDKYDDSIPLPQNLKVVSGVDQTITGTSLEKLGAFNKDIVLTWEQPEIPDGMQFEIEAEFSAKRLADDNYSDYKEYTGEYHTVVQKTAYGETSTVTVSVDHKTMNAMKEKGFLTKVNFRVRNCINNKTSDWVLVTVDIANKTATATQQGYEDNSNTGGDTYNDTNVDASDNNKNVVDSSNINFGSLSNFIKDGFGLIGNGGIITLMSRTFTFLPGTFWTIIYFFVSMLVFVCVIKLIKDVIF